jgi:hypothetical protein
MKPLTRFDPQLGRFVLDTEKPPTYWRGTKIKKSLDNDFNWRGKPASIKFNTSTSPKPDLKKGESVRVYAKARKY